MLDREARKEFNEAVEANGGIDVPKGLVLSTRIYKATLEKSLVLLDKDQKKSWEGMVGDPFTYTLDRFQLDDKGEYKKVGK